MSSDAPGDGHGTVGALFPRMQSTGTGQKEKGRLPPPRNRMAMTFDTAVSSGSGAEGRQGFSNPVADLPWATGRGGVYDVPMVYNGGYYMPQDRPYHARGRIPVAYPASGPVNSGSSGRMPAMSSDYGCSGYSGPSHVRGNAMTWQQYLATPYAHHEPAHSGYVSQGDRCSDGGPPVQFFSQGGAEPMYYASPGPVDEDMYSVPDTGSLPTTRGRGGMPSSSDGLLQLPPKQSYGKQQQQQAPLPPSSGDPFGVTRSVEGSAPSKSTQDQLQGQSQGQGQGKGAASGSRRQLKPAISSRERWAWWAWRLLCKPTRSNNSGGSGGATSGRDRDRRVVTNARKSGASSTGGGQGSASGVVNQGPTGGAAAAMDARMRDVAGKAGGAQEAAGSGNKRGGGSGGSGGEAPSSGNKAGSTDNDNSGDNRAEAKSGEGVGAHGSGQGSGGGNSPCEDLGSGDRSGEGSGGGGSSPCEDNGSGEGSGGGGSPHEDNGSGEGSGGGAPACDDMDQDRDRDAAAQGGSNNRVEQHSIAGGGGEEMANAAADETVAINSSAKGDSNNARVGHGVAEYHLHHQSHHLHRRHRSHHHHHVAGAQDGNTSERDRSSHVNQGGREAQSGVTASDAAAIIPQQQGSDQGRGSGSGPDAGSGNADSGAGGSNLDKQLENGSGGNGSGSASAEAQGAGSGVEGGGSGEGAHGTSGRSSGSGGNYGGTAGVSGSGSGDGNRSGRGSAREGSADMDAEGNAEGNRSGGDMDGSGGGSGTGEAGGQNIESSLQERNSNKDRSRLKWKGANGDSATSSELPNPQVHPAAIMDVLGATRFLKMQQVMIRQQHSFVEQLKELHEAILEQHRLSVALRQESADPKALSKGGEGESQTSQGRGGQGTMVKGSGGGGGGGGAIPHRGLRQKGNTARPIPSVNSHQLSYTSLQQGGRDTSPPSAAGDSFAVVPSLSGGYGSGLISEGRPTQGQQQQSGLAPQLPGQGGPQVPEDHPHRGYRPAMMAPVPAPPSSVQAVRYPMGMSGPWEPLPVGPAPGGPLMGPMVQIMPPVGAYEMGMGPDGPPAPPPPVPPPRFSGYPQEPDTGSGGYAGHYQGETPGYRRPMASPSVPYQSVWFSPNVYGGQPPGEMGLGSPGRGPAGPPGPPPGIVRDQTWWEENPYLGMHWMHKAEAPEYYPPLGRPQQVSSRRGVSAPTMLVGPGGGYGGAGGGAGVGPVGAAPVASADASMYVGGRPTMSAPDRLCHPHPGMLVSGMGRGPGASSVGMRGFSDAMRAGTSDINPSINNKGRGGGGSGSLDVASLGCVSTGRVTGNAKRHRPVGRSRRARSGEPGDKPSGRSSGGASGGGNKAASYSHAGERGRSAHMLADGGSGRHRRGDASSSGVPSEGGRGGTGQSTEGSPDEMRRNVRHRPPQSGSSGSDQSSDRPMHVAEPRDSSVPLSSIERTASLERTASQCAAGPPLLADGSQSRERTTTTAATTVTHNVGAVSQPSRSKNSSGTVTQQDGRRERTGRVPEQ
eukprot:jgi/Mesvir1/11822/Mv00174-RA.1